MRNSSALLRRAPKARPFDSVAAAAAELVRRDRGQCIECLKAIPGGGVEYTPEELSGHIWRHDPGEADGTLSCAKKCGRLYGKTHSKKTHETLCDGSPYQGPPARLPDLTSWEKGVLKRERVPGALRRGETMREVLVCRMGCGREFARPCARAVHEKSSKTKGICKGGTLPAAQAPRWRSRMALPDTGDGQKTAVSAVTALAVREIREEAGRLQGQVNLLKALADKIEAL